jgi:hypothetical protein
MSQPKPKDRKPGRPEQDRTWDYWHRTDMCHTITLYIPSKVRAGKLITGIDRKKLVDAAMKFLLTKLGGATQTKGVGYYAELKPNGDIDKIHAEKVTLCRSLCTTENLVKHRADLRRLANSFAIEFQQASIAVEIDGEFHFFSPTDAYETQYRRLVKSGTIKSVLGYEQYIHASLDSADDSNKHS